MKILFAASEALPFVSTGGLADVIGSLPAALARQGNDVRVVIPLYSAIDQKWREEMKFICAVRIKLSWRNQYCGIFSYEYNGVTFYFLDNEYYFKRLSLYGNYDDGERFAFFSKAILDILPYVDFIPDIIHTNDWQTSLVPIYLKQCYSHVANYRAIKSIHTIHNIEYQGIYDFNVLDDVFSLAPSQASIVEYKGSVNLTKGAIVCCDRLTTVSPNYAKQILTEEYSSGLNFILNMYREKLSGILNGINIDYYNPEFDPSLKANYTAADMSGKSENKKDLQQSLSLPVRDNIPMFSMISRLASHKGFDLVTAVLEGFLSENDVQFVVLGRGEIQYERFFTRMSELFPTKCRCIIDYNKELANRIYAASDLFLMPSKSEPCGLSQMIASRFGTIPIVRETGGLYDSIKPYISSTKEGNGFTFASYNAYDMLYVMKQALRLYCDNKDEFTDLQKKVMTVDFSWNASAQKYIKLYKETIG